MTFSIIVPVHNVELWLRACLDSVCGQLCGDWECICVDDGSTDGSGSILDEYARRDERFRVVHQVNAGVSAARNAALELATGEWICFLDADDLLESHFLQTLSKLVDKHEDVDLVRLRQTRFQDGSECKLEEVADFQPMAVDLRWHIPFDVAENGFLGIFYRHDRMRNVWFKPYSLGEDRLYYAQCLIRARRLLDCAAPLYLYRIRSNSAMHGKVPRAKRVEGIKARLRRLAIFALSPKHVDWRVYRRSLALVVTHAFLVFRAGNGHDF